MELGRNTNMKKFKMIASATLALAMMTGVTGCFSSPKAEKFYNFADENFDCKEYTVKKLDKLGTGSDYDEAMADGILLYLTDEDDIDDFADYIEETNNKKSSKMNNCIVDFDDCKTKDIKALSYYIKEEEGDKNMLSEAIVAIDFADSKAAKNAFENMMDRVEDDLEVDFDKLSKDEFKYSGSNGYMIVNVEEDVLLDAFVSYYISARGYSDDKETRKEVREMVEDEIGDMNCYQATYLQGSSIISVVCLTIKGDTDDIEDFCEEFKLTCPTDIENSDELNDALSENFIAN